ncbi:hypothetical protein DCAR_0934350 [Daucus carota subsp. sativus]|uniref:Uncharacterized protein n=1 Tax=Daucus carota subsp. sativus TaxID=79200 RepID=A0AAF1BFB2_DAUCS|nr:hypothetical protein DCAR_0934350 [Daucus carota subsp. sativus]
MKEVSDGDHDISSDGWEARFAGLARQSTSDQDRDQPSRDPEHVTPIGNQHPPESLDLLKNLRRHQDEDVLKGQAVKNQKALWDKTLELRFLLQKAFSNSNRLPQDPIRSSFCDSYSETSEAYSDLITTSKKTLDSIQKLQEALLEKNPTITQGADASENLIAEEDQEWSKISEMQSRIVSFRNKSVDKWQRRTQVTTGATAIKGKLQAFNQSISDQVSAYMRDPSRMVNGMQQRRSAIAIFGTSTYVPSLLLELIFAFNQIGGSWMLDSVNGDPELLDDSEFYQQLLKEFFETIDPTSSECETHMFVHLATEAAFYALKRMQTKKRKVVDQRASKSRKIRYHVLEKIVNFMAPRSMNLPPVAPKLFENLFGLKVQKAA